MPSRATHTVARCTPSPSVSASMIIETRRRSPFATQELALGEVHPGLADRLAGRLDELGAAAVVELDELGQHDVVEIGVVGDAEQLHARPGSGTAADRRAR